MLNKIFPDEPRLGFDEHRALGTGESSPTTYIYLISEAHLVRYFSAEFVFHWLDNSERIQFSQFVANKRKSEFVYSRFLIKAILAHHLSSPARDIQLVKQDHLGKPKIVGHVQKKLDFNLSHCDGLLALCVTRNAELGVDIEMPAVNMMTDINRIAAQHFSVSEARQIRQSTLQESVRQFYRMWTLKESGLKTLGVGLTAPMGYVDTSQLNFSDCIAVPWCDKLNKIYSSYYFDEMSDCHLCVSRLNENSSMIFIDTDSIINHLLRY